MKKRIAAAAIILFMLPLPSHGMEEVFLPAWAAIEADTPDVAVMELKKMGPSEEKKPLYWFYLGTAYRKEGKYNESLDAFMSGLNLADGNGMHGMLYHGLGLTYAKMDKIEEALDSIMKAVGKEPGNAGFHNDMGVIRLIRGEIEKGIDSFTTAYRLSRSPDILKNIAFAYGMKKDYEKAREILIPAFPLYEVYYTMGLIHELNKEGERAAELYDLAVTVNSGYEPAVNRLKKLQAPEKR